MVSKNMRSTPVNRWKRIPVNSFSAVKNCKHMFAGQFESPPVSTFTGWLGNFDYILLLSTRRFSLNSNLLRLCGVTLPSKSSTLVILERQCLMNAGGLLCRNSGMASLYFLCVPSIFIFLMTYCLCWSGK